MIVNIDFVNTFRRCLVDDLPNRIGRVREKRIELSLIFTRIPFAQVKRCRTAGRIRLVFGNRNDSKLRAYTPIVCYCNFIKRFFFICADPYPVYESLIVRRVIAVHTSACIRRHVAVCADNDVGTYRRSVFETEFGAILFGFDTGNAAAILYLDA